MEHSPRSSSLPDGFESLPFPEALVELLRAHRDDVDTIQETEAKRRALAEYIEGLRK